MEYKDYLVAQDFIEQRASALMSHERKDSAQVGFPIANYKEYTRGQRVFYAVRTSMFIDILTRDLLNAQEQFPLNFGNGNAICVIHALEKTIGLYGGTKRAVRLLQSENCCWVLENENGRISERVLRIDLFRKLDKTRHKKRKYEFTGGLLHVFKHFSYNGKSLSTGNDKNEYVPDGVIGLLIDAFFLHQGTFINEAKTEYLAYVGLNSRYRLKTIFYREANTEVFFLKTMYKERIKS